MHDGRAREQPPQQGGDGTRTTRPALTPAAAARPSPSSTRRPSRWSTISTARSRPSRCRNTPSCPRSTPTRKPSGPRATALAKEHAADPLITYMHLLYKKAKERNVRIDRGDLVAQGKHVEMYPGVEGWFDAIGGYVKEHAQSHGVVLRHYLISSGLTEIIEGTSIYKRFHNVFASRILVRGLRPALPQARHHRHRQDAVPVPHQQGRGGPGREHQPAHARGRAADPVRQHDLLRRRRHRRAVDGGDAQERRPCGRRLSLRPGQGQGQVRRPVQGRPLRFLRARRLPHAAPTSSSAPACCSTACWPTSACRRRCGAWGGG